MSQPVDAHADPLDALVEGISITTDTIHQFRVELATLHVRLPINPKHARSLDDRFRLLMISSEGQYEQVKTVSDDAMPGDDAVDLIYANLHSGARYSLEVDPGADGAPYFVFEEMSFAELFAKS